MRTGATPSKVTASGGVFGRFRYAPTRNVFVAVNSVDESVFVLRMAPGTGTPPPIPDGGAAGAGGSGGGGATTGGTKGGEADDDSGCGCAVPQRRGGSAWALVALALLFHSAAARRGRRREREALGRPCLPTNDRAASPRRAARVTD